MGSTLHWWTLLCGVALVNVAAWLATAMAVRRTTPHGIGDSRHTQLLLSAGYVFGCAYRSLLPVYDIQRLCLVDSWLSSVIVGRTVATVAELCEMPVGPTVSTFPLRSVMLCRPSARDTTKARPSGRVRV